MTDSGRTFGDVVDAHQAAALRYLRRLTGDPAAAEDLFQETFLRALPAFDRLRTGSNHRAWIYRIATNAFLNHRRRQRRRNEMSLGVELAAPVQSPDRQHQARAAATACRQAVVSLPLEPMSIRPPVDCDSCWPTWSDVMTCGEFNQELDALLSRDVAYSEWYTPPVREHVERCSQCSRIWSRVSSLLDVMTEPESDREVEVAVERVERAREHLRGAFSRMGRPVVRFDVLQTPIGRVFVGMSDRGVCDVTLDDPDEHDYRLRLAHRAQEVWRDRDVVEPALTELDAYFRGRLTKFTVPIDLRGVTDFTRRVLRATRRIPFGALLSYGEVASRIGSPRASRAVGGALGCNPIPIIVPCHRVIAHGKRLGGFTGGLAAKRTLLRIEGHVPRAAL